VEAVEAVMGPAVVVAVVAVVAAEAGARSTG
jgi:hypothetical protein